MSDSISHVLRKIYTAGIPVNNTDLSNLGDCVNVNDELDVNVTNFPATQPISGSVSITGTPAVTVSSGSINATVQNFPATQPVSGSVSITGTPSVTVSSGSINTTVQNFPATQPVSGTVSISGTPAVTVSSGSVNATCSGTVAVSSLGGTSAVSLATLPCMYIPNGINTLNSSADKGNLCLTVEYGVGKFNPLVCNSTQRLLVADTVAQASLTNIESYLLTIKNILTDIWDDANNRINTHNT